MAVGIDRHTTMDSVPAEWFSSHAPLLIVTHIRPDGDAFGSVAGLGLMLRENRVACCPYMSTAPGRRYGRVIPPGILENSLSSERLDDFRGIVALDCSNPERLDLPKGLGDRWRDMPVLSVDHHPDNHEYGSITLVQPAAAATAQVLFEMALRLGWTCPPQAADCLLVGLLTDTGGLRFANTTADVLECASRLVEQGAGYHRVVDALFFRESLGRARVQARMLETAEFAAAGRIAITVVTPEMLTEEGVAEQDTENLIDIVRTLDTVQIACLFQPEKGDVRVSLRSRSAAFPVGQTARRLGGGGHAAAAGLTLENTNLDEARRRVVPLLVGLLETD